MSDWDDFREALTDLRLAIGDIPLRPHLADWPQAMMLVGIGLWRGWQDSLGLWTLPYTALLLAVGFAMTRALILWCRR